MNDNTRKHKPRKCLLSESQLAEFAELMKKRFYSHKELADILKDRYGYNSEVSYVMDYLDIRGWMVALEEQPSKTGFKNYYKVVTVQDYEKNSGGTEKKCLQKVPGENFLKIYL